MVRCSPRALAFQPNQYGKPFDQNLGSPLIYFFYMHTTIRQKCMILFHLIFLLCTTIRPKIRSTLIYFSYLHTTIQQKYMVLFHLFFLLCSTIRLKIKVHTDLFLYTTIQPKVRVLINLFILFVHDHSTENQGPH